MVSSVITSTTLGMEFITSRGSSLARLRVPERWPFRGRSSSYLQVILVVSRMMSVSRTLSCVAGLTCAPLPVTPLPNTYFVDLTTDYFGLAVRECLRSASTVVPGARGADKLVGPRGAVLPSATCKGDGWRTQHDSAQYFQWRALKDHGVRAELERYGLFGDVFDELHQAHPELWGKVEERKRHAAVPDTGVFSMVRRRCCLSTRSCTRIPRAIHLARVEVPSVPSGSVPVATAAVGKQGPGALTSGQAR